VHKGVAVLALPGWKATPGGDASTRDGQSAGEVRSASTKHTVLASSVQCRRVSMHACTGENRCARKKGNQQFRLDAARRKRVRWRAGVHGDIAVERA
jgi:hypothetical protein